MEQTEDVLERADARQLSAHDVAGVPRLHTIPLTVLRHTDGRACHFVPPSGLYIGLICYGDTTLTFSPVVVPDMNTRDVVFAIELTSCDRMDDDPTCSVKFIYLSQDGKSRGLVTPPVPAAGDVLRISVPTRHVRPGHVLAASAQITLMDQTPDGVSLEVPDGIESSGRRPVLVRGAWLEFPSGAAK